jgi:hypothetical protein
MNESSLNRNNSYFSSWSVKRLASSEGAGLNKSSSLITFLRPSLRSGVIQLIREIKNAKNEIQKKNILETGKTLKKISRRNLHLIVDFRCRCASFHPLHLSAVLLIAIFLLNIANFSDNLKVEL